MKSYYLAFDIGASSGRTILGEVSDNKITLTEVQRFTNKYIKVLGHYYWNIYNIFEELQNGITAYMQKSDAKIESIGIDTWGVDFGLLDKGGNILSLPYSYRDHITDGIIEKFTSKVVDAKKLYNITGIQFLKFNSLFQLYAISGENKTLIDNASEMLFIPDLLNYLFTGIKKTEYSIASTSQMLNVKSRNWSDELLKASGASKKIFTDIVMPGTIIGNISSDVADSLNISPVPVVAVAEHDTGSAIVAVPATGDNWAYLSSGTWSLMGLELSEPNISEKSFEYGFTNEGGYGGTIRFLKNISGLWLLEQCKRHWDNKYDYQELIEMSKKESPFQSYVNPDDAMFANPVNMPDAIKEYCRKTGQVVPETTGQIARTIFDSLAMKYRQIMEMLKELSPKPIEKLHIIGGGCRNEMLCQLTADALGMQVIAGPSEATAIGNILVQHMTMRKDISSLEEARKIVANSFELIKYSPKDTGEWDKAYPVFKGITA